MIGALGFIFLVIMLGITLKFIDEPKKVFCSGIVFSIGCLILLVAGIALTGVWFINLLCFSGCVFLTVLLPND